MSEMDNTVSDYCKELCRINCLSIEYLLLKRKQPRQSVNSGLSKRSSLSLSPYGFMISASPMFNRNTKPRKMARSEHFRDCGSSGSDSGIGSIRDTDFVEIGSSIGSNCETSDLSLNGDDKKPCGFVGFSREFRSTSSHVNIGKCQGRRKDKERCLSDDVFDKDFDYDSDTTSSVSSSARKQCSKCGCIPSFSWTRNRVRKSGSFSRKSRSNNSSWLRVDKDSLLKDFASRYGDSCSEDDTRCLLNVLYADHICIDSDFCNRKSLSALNAHLKHLVDCMPQPNHDQGPKTSTSSLSNCELEKSGYIPYRRNAVCETSEESRMKFYHALCSFMTLKALVRYDFL